MATLPRREAPIDTLAFDDDGRTLAVGGHDEVVTLWDLALVRRELADRGLDWDDQVPDAPTATTAGPAVAHDGEPAVPVIRPGETDPAELDEARRLLQAGVDAIEAGRMAEAIRDLRQARDRLRVLHRADPGDDGVASQLARSQGALGSALRDEHRPAEALTSLREARQVMEAMSLLSSVELYNMACVYAGLSTLVEPGTASSPSDGRETLADRAVQALRRALAGSRAGIPLMDRDRDLDPLRNRPDFRLLILDREFPSEPFAGP
jgi:hypothetical protein